MVPICKEPAILRRTLFGLYKRRKYVFEKLFVFEGRAELSKSISRILLDANLISVLPENLFASNVRIWKIGGKLIATDLFSYNGMDRVYPIFIDESDFLANNLAVKYGDEVLDIGTGSGIQAICCAEKAKNVLALDISKRALAFARFNSELNGTGNKIDFLQSDLFKKIGKRRFNIIVSNPPFIAVPSNGAWFLHGSAGCDGMKIFKRIIRGAKKHLKQDGRIQIITNSFGHGEKILAIEIMRKYFQKNHLRVVYVMTPKKIRTDMFTKKFQDAQGFEKWKNYLARHNFSDFYRMLINICPAKKFSLETIQNKSFRFNLREAFGNKPYKVKPYYSGGWDEMLCRYGNIAAKQADL